MIREYLDNESRRPLYASSRWPTRSTACPVWSTGSADTCAAGSGNRNRRGTSTQVEGHGASLWSKCARRRVLRDSGSSIPFRTAGQRILKIASTRVVDIGHLRNKTRLRQILFCYDGSKSVRGADCVWHRDVRNRRRGGCRGCGGRCRGRGRGRRCRCRRPRQVEGGRGRWRRAHAVVERAAPTNHNR